MKFRNILDWIKLGGMFIERMLQTSEEFRNLAGGCLFLIFLGMLAAGLMIAALYDVQAGMILIVYGIIILIVAIRIVNYRG